MQGEELDQLMMQRGFRLQHALSRKVDSASTTPRSSTSGGISSRPGDPLNGPFRNGYSLTHKYERQLNGSMSVDGSEEVAVGYGPTAVPTMLL